MTLQEKVKGMQERMNELRKKCRRDDQRRHCYSLLHDAVLFTGSRIDELGDGSLVGFIELASVVVEHQGVNFRYVRNKLIELGFNTVPVN
jgi:hypothetical protein